MDSGKFGMLEFLAACSKASVLRRSVRAVSKLDSLDASLYFAEASRLGLVSGSTDSPKVTRDGYNWAAGILEPLAPLLVRVKK